MALSTLGWLIGLSAVFIVSFSCGFGIFFIYKSIKLNARLLLYLGLGIIFIGSALSSVVTDFVSVLTTGENINIVLFDILTYSVATLGGLCFIYVAAEILYPKRKKIIIYSCLFLIILLEVLIFLDPINSFTYNNPESSERDLIHSSIAIGTPVALVFIIYIIHVFIFVGVGFLKKALESEGIIRKKFFMLSLGAFIHSIAAILDGTLYPGLILIFVRLSWLSGHVLYYFGLKETPEKREKIHPRKEIKITDSLFRITKRPDQITEEEVSISKEKKICLVCKGKVGRYMFMCPECETFYCEKCAHALENLENACWACGESIDESKPVKSFKKEEEVDIEISEKPKKK